MVAEQLLSHCLRDYDLGKQFQENFRFTNCE